MNLKQLKQSQSLQAYEILHAGFVIAPLTAGVDKFTNRLTNWDQYLAEQVPSRLGMTPKSFMKLVGAIEISAGIGVAVKPKVFGYVVSAWLCGIAGNFLMKRQYLDIALRDVGLALGALALARLSHQHEGAIRHSFRRNQVGLRAVPALGTPEHAPPAVRAA
ncbi:MAG: hypothetical protein ACJ763_01045 [Bdellovibrionia bacterium]